MIEIRRDTFKNAIDRQSTDYIYIQDYQRPVQVPTEHYPNHKLMRYPKHYTLQTTGQTDIDLCEKTAKQKGDFNCGVFSIGCSCKNNITYGFELEKNR